MSEDKEAFLERWSRLKHKDAADKPAVPAEKKDEPPAAPLSPVDGLTPDSDFRPFMDAKVDPGTRRSALKKLFADAHYSIPDPFEAYSEDYTKSDPIPMQMLKTLNQAQKLIFDEAEKVAQAPAGNSESHPDAPKPEATDVAGKQDT